MSILITGGTGKTGAPLAHKLREAGHNVLVASRSGSATEFVKGVKFDWNDPSTFENPFHMSFNIKAIYLVGPPTVDMLPLVKPFIDLAVLKGVTRFVLLSATMAYPGGPGTGQVHTYLAGLKGIEYVVLRPSWFMENFRTSFLSQIRDRNEIVTATGDGKLPFIAVDDIVDAAIDALTSPNIHTPDLFIPGPELYNYDEAAEIFSKALGRKITHRKVTVQEGIETWRSFGAPQDIAEMLGNMDGQIAKGKEESVVEEKNKYVGKVRLLDWVEQNKSVWQ